MRKMFFAALAAVAMFVTSCGSSVEYETLSITTTVGKYRQLCLKVFIN